MIVKVKKIEKTRLVKILINLKNTFYDQKEMQDIMLTQDRDKSRNIFIIIVCTRMFDFNWISFLKK